MPQDGTIWRAPYDTFFKRREDGVVVIYQTADRNPDSPRYTFEISMSMAELVDIVGFLSGAQSVTFNTAHVTPEEYTLALTEAVPGHFINVPPRVGFAGMPDDAVIQPITNITADELIGGTIDIGTGNTELKTAKIRDSIDADRVNKEIKNIKEIKYTGNNSDSPSPLLPLSGDDAIDSGADDDTSAP